MRAEKNHFVGRGCLTRMRSHKPCQRCSQRLTSSFVRIVHYCLRSPYNHWHAPPKLPATTRHSTSLSLLSRQSRPSLATPGDSTTSLPERCPKEQQSRKRAASMCSLSAPGLRACFAQMGSPRTASTCASSTSAREKSLQGRRTVSSHGRLKSSRSAACGVLSGQPFV